MKLYIRYADDILLLTKEGDIDNIVNRFKIFDDNLKFSIVKFHFLNIKIDHNETDFFYKITYTGQYYGGNFFLQITTFFYKLQLFSTNHNFFPEVQLFFPILRLFSTNYNFFLQYCNFSLQTTTFFYSIATFPKILSGLPCLPSEWISFCVPGAIEVSADAACGREPSLA